MYIMPSPANADYKFLEGILPTIHLDHSDPRDHLVHDLHTFVCVLGRSAPACVSRRCIVGYIGLCRVVTCHSAALYNPIL